MDGFEIPHSSAHLSVSRSHLKAWGWERPLSFVFWYLIVAIRGFFLLSDCISKSYAWRKKKVTEGETLSWDSPLYKWGIVYVYLQRVSWKVKYLFPAFLLWKQAVICMVWFTFFKFHFENGSLFFFLLVVQRKLVFYFTLTLIKEFQNFFSESSFKKESI